MRRRICVTALCGLSLATVSTLCCCGEQNLTRDGTDRSTVLEERYDLHRSGEVKNVLMALPSLPGEREVAVEVIDGMMVYEGDIVVGRLNQGRITQGVAKDQAHRLWPDGVIPYDFDNQYPASWRQKVEDALAALGQKTNLSFVRRTNQQDYVEIIDGSGCWSWISKIGGKQELSLYTPKSSWDGHCVWTGTVQHEFLHAAGFYHEQSRFDRDGYVKILWGNIKSGKEHNFEKVSKRSYDINEYDFASLMHYRLNSFSVDPKHKNTIEPLPGKVPPGVKIGQRDDPSPADIAAINERYPGVVPPSGKPDISANPSSIDFGSVNVGSSQTAQATLSNGGDANLSVGALSVANDVASVFALQGDSCSNQTLAPNQSCAVTAVFSPTAAGAAQASIRVPSNDPDTPELSVGLSGTGESASCHPDSPFGWNYCREGCQCQEGEGDCDENRNECAPGLVCAQNVGAKYGVSSSVDVCEKPAVDCHNYPLYDYRYCTKACPCSTGEGDCDDHANHTDCQPGLKCVRNVGADYGQPSWVDVCR